MKKTQSFIESNSKWQILNDYIVRMDPFLDMSPGLVIENCKALIETIFKTILVEVESRTTEELQKKEIGELYNLVKNILFLSKKGYCNIVGSFTNAMSEFRNKLGEVSHGKDIYTLESNQKSLFEDELIFLLNTTDCIAFFILSYYKNLFPGYAEKRKELKYEENMEFNNNFDETQEPIKLAGVLLNPSRVLFDGDKEAYKIVLSDFLEISDLIERIRISPNFSSTHSLISELSQIQNFSKEQIKKLFDAFFENNQINLIASDLDIEVFYKDLIDENQELFEDEALSAFYSYF